MKTRMNIKLKKYSKIKREKVIKKVKEKKEIKEGDDIYCYCSYHLRCMDQNVFRLSLFII